MKDWKASVIALLIVLAALGVAVVIAIAIPYVIATSDLPVWFKFFLLS